MQGVTDYAIYMLDPDGAVTNWNTGAQRIKGYSEDEIVGQHFSRFYTARGPGSGAPGACACRRLRAKDASRRRLARPQGRHPVLGHVVIDPIRDDPMEPCSASPRSRATSPSAAKPRSLWSRPARALFQSQKMEAIGQLTGGIAHDFNNLLTVIVNGLDLLSRRIQDPKDTKIVEGMHRAAERGQSLNRQLLAFARRQPLKPETANPNAVIKGFEAVLRRACGELITVDITLASSVRSMEVDVPQFEAALLNLVVNARDAMPEGGKIMISSRNVTLDQERANRLGLQPGRYVALTVGDSGPGIPEDVRTRVFEPFFTTKEIGKGTGLGLSQVYGFVTQSGGQVELDTQSGKGTRVHLFIPAIPGGEGEDNDEGEGEVAQPPRQSLGTVLIVEDEPDVLEMAIQIFESLGYDVLSASNARAALDVLKQEEQIDVLFSDIVMPGGMNGVELAQEARRMRPALKLLLASGYPMSALDHPDLKEISFISKPYRWTELDERLRALRTGSH